jgi:hypothetical protein
MLTFRSALPLHSAAEGGNVDNENPARAHEFTQLAHHPRREQQTDAYPRE